MAEQRLAEHAPDPLFFRETLGGPVAGCLRALGAWCEHTPGHRALKVLLVRAAPDCAAHESPDVSLDWQEMARSLGRARASLEALCAMSQALAEEGVRAFGSDLRHYAASTARECDRLIASLVDPAASQQINLKEVELALFTLRLQIDERVGQLVTKDSAS